MPMRYTRSVYTVAALIGFAASSAYATEGYFQHGYGARHKALAGAGVADGRDATAPALNPAGLIHSPNEVTFSLSLFSPRREIEGSGAAGFTPTGVVESDSNYFFIPNIAFSYKLAPNPYVDVVGVTLYGNGGMNTDWPAVARPDGGCAFAGGGTGIFCRGVSGVDLQQAFLSVTLAKQFGSFAIGVAPILARQQFSADGLDLFGVTTSSTDVSWGYGARAGIEWSVTPNVRLGLAGSSRIYMQEFDKYANLFAEQGDFDIPPSMQVGIAADVMPNLTLMADYRRIWYNSVKAIANPSTNAFCGAVPLGCDNGPGFGWQDVDVFKVAAEWRMSNDLTWRAGYAYNTSPIESRDVMFNILAPGVVQHHFTGGLEYRFGPAWSIEAAVMFAPESDVKGSERGPAGSPAVAAHNIELRMYQYEATVGVKYRF
jgi:long-chain fatty acid transport protein